MSQSCCLIHSDPPCSITVKLHDESGHLVAYSPLPYKFIVKANGNGVSTGGKRARSTVIQQTLRSEFPVQNPLSASTLEPRLLGSPAHFQPLSMDQYSQLNSNYIASALHRLAPSEGPVGGGSTILLSGVNFPPPSQHILYARFGTVVVPTVWLLLHSRQKTNYVHRSGTIHTRSNASCLVLRPWGHSKLPSHYIKSPGFQNLARATAGLNTIRNMVTVISSHRERNVKRLEPGIKHSTVPFQP